jgi:hypothetical protein
MAPGVAPPPAGGALGGLAAGRPRSGRAGRFGRLTAVCRGRLGAGLLALALAGAAGGLAVGAAAGGGWLPVEVVAHTPSVSSEPAVAVAGDGTVWVAWQDGGDVLVARDSGTGWSAAERVGSGFGADIAMAGNTPHVVFVSDLTDHLDVVYSFRDDGGWVLPRTVSSTLSLGAGPALAVSGAARFLVWADSGRLFFGRSGDGAVWQVQPVLINGLPVDGAAPDVASDPGGVVDLVWHTVVDGVERVRHADWQGGRWSLAEDLTGDGDPAARSPSLALLPGGERLVTWLAGDGPNGRAVQGTIGSTGWWSPPAAVSSGTSAAGAPRVAGHAAGADVAWPAVAGGVRFRAYRSGVWLPEETVTDAPAVDVSIAASADVAHVAWSAPAGADNWDITLRRRRAAAVPTATDPFTPTPVASDTATVPLPTDTATGTATPRVPSATPTASVRPTATATASGTATAPRVTVPPPTSTATAVPSATVTPARRTGTPTASPTRTASPTPTATAPPTATATRPDPLYLPWLAGRRAPRSVHGSGTDPVPAAVGAPDPGAGRPAARSAASTVETWTAPEVIARLPGETWQMSVALDAAGQPHVMWEEGAELRHTYRVAGVWQEPRHVAYGEAPSLAVDRNGVLHALFANTFEDNQDVYFITYQDGAWTLPENVSGTSTYSTAPVLRTGDASAPLVATWSEIAATGPQVYYGWWDGRWHFTPVSQARGLGATVAVDDSGPVLAWHGRAAADRPYDIYASRGQDARGRAWSLPENVSDTPDTDSVVASLALDQQTWHVAWREGPAAAVGVDYARRYAAGWSEIEALASASNGPPVVLAAPGGAREVVWLADAGAWSARGFGEDGPWQMSPLPPAAGALAVAAASDGDGGLHLVWAEAGEGGSVVLRYARRLGCAGCRALVPLAVKLR